MRYAFTVETIAQACGLAVSTLRWKIERIGTLVTPDALKELARLVQRYASRASVPLSDAEGFALLDPTCPVTPERLAQWSGRWPRFDVFRCASPGCAEALLQEGFCGRHGGPERPAMAFDSNYVVLRVAGAYVPLHRVIMGCPRGMDVHHVDKNKWNNRPENLRAMTHAEHWALHHEGQRRPAPPAAGP